MAKLLHKLLMFLSSLTLISAGTGKSTLRTSVPTKFIRVYLHVFLSGPNQTTFEVDRASITAPPVNFGMVRVASDYMATGPDLNTGTMLGRAEVLIAYTGQTEAAAVIHFVIIFEAGRYRGRSISMLGRKRAGNFTERAGNFTEEVPIVGGTGQFLGACGYSLSYIYSYDPVADRMIYVYDFYVKK